MTNDANCIVKKLWSYCNVLRDDGLSYGDYLEQLTYLLFLKMADEQTKPPWRRPSPVPEGYDWPSLTSRDGADPELHYRALLLHLGKQHGLLGLVFRKAQNKIQDPAKLKRLVVRADRGDPRRSGGGGVTALFSFNPKQGRPSLGSTR